MLRRPHMSFLIPAVSQISLGCIGSQACCSMVGSRNALRKTDTVDIQVTSPVLQVNKIRELPQHPAIIVTHTDAPELYVWNTVTQPNMTRDTVRHSYLLRNPREVHRSVVALSAPTPHFCHHILPPCSQHQV